MFKLKFKKIKLKFEDLFRRKKFEKVVERDKISAKELAMLFYRKMKAKDVKATDRNYDLVELNELMQVLRNCFTKNLIYKKDVFDCDNFALSLHAEINYQFKQRKEKNIVFATIWADVKGIGTHQFNAFVDKNCEIYFVEPQKCEVVDYDVSNVEFVYVV